MKSCFGITFLTLCMCVFTSSAAENSVSDAGSVDRLAAGKGWINLKTDIVIPTSGWKKRFSLSSANATVNQTLYRKAWRATLGEKEEMPIEIEQGARMVKGKVILDIQAVAHADADIEGIILTLDVPATAFAGGLYAAATEVGDLPRTLPERYHFCSTTAGSMVLADAAHKAKLKAEFDNYVQVQIQDSRNWSDTFTAFIFVHSGALKKDEVGKLKIALWGDGEVDESEAHLQIDPDKTLYRIEGIGGSYCFNVNSAISHYTLQNLPFSFSRAGMSLAQWQPDAKSARETNDLPDSALRHEFEMYRELSKRKVPYVASIWDLPVWLYKDGKTTASGTRNKVPRDLWPDLCDCICSYLVYARDRYQAMPDYFSFNEPDGGVRVYFSAEEHRDFIKMLGARLVLNGLKTKMLLGDVANPRDSLSYPDPAILDSEAMKHVGALSLHSWGGAEPDQYRRWSSLASRINLPLYISEAGPDADYESKPFYRPFAYVDEMVHYQQLFMYAHPQAVVYWEYSGNYPLLKPGISPSRFKMTERMCLQKHWCEFIPSGSYNLPATSDNGHVLVTAFSHDDPRGKSITIHIANPDWARKVVITGIPSVLTALNAVRTAKGEYFNLLSRVPVEDGKVTLNLPEQSLTTLTTIGVPELPEP